MDRASLVDCVEIFRGEPSRVKFFLLALEASFCLERKITIDAPATKSIHKNMKKQHTPAQSLLRTPCFPEITFHFSKRSGTNQCDRFLLMIVCKIVRSKRKESAAVFLDTFLKRTLPRQILQQWSVLAVKIEFAFEKIEQSVDDE